MALHVPLAESERDLLNSRTGVVVVSIVVLAIVAGAASMYFILPRTTISNNTASTVTTRSSRSITTVCTVAVPPPQGIYLRVITDDTGTPVSGLQVIIQSEEAASCDRNNVQLTNSVAVTNSSGWIMFRQGFPWYFVFTYSSYTYNFTVPSSPMSWSVDTISVPSGKLSTEICGLGGGSLNSSCETASTTTVSLNSQSWRVLKTGVTVYYDTACLVLGFIGHTCPTKNTVTQTPSLTNLELIAYKGAEFYAGNFTTGPYGYAHPFTQAVWFTNSTIFCATPPAGDYPACPENYSSSSSSSAATVTSSVCFRTGEGWAFYVRVIADGTGAPIAGATVNAFPYVSCQVSSSSSTIITINGAQITLITPENGTVSLPVGTSVDGYSSLRVDYQGVDYPIGNVYVAPTLITTVTLSIPSGVVEITESTPSH